MLIEDFLDLIELHRKSKTAATKAVAKAKKQSPKIPGHGRTLERMFQPNLYRLSRVAQDHAHVPPSKCGEVLTSTGNTVRQANLG